MALPGVRGETGLPAMSETSSDGKDKKELGREAYRRMLRRIKFKSCRLMQTKNDHESMDGDSTVPLSCMVNALLMTELESSMDCTVMAAKLNVGLLTVSEKLS